MQMKWVGSLVAIIMLLMSIGTAVSAPSDDVDSDDFRRPDPGRWVLVNGNMSYDTHIGPTGELLTWLVVTDDDDAGGTGPSRVVANGSYTTWDGEQWNTASSSYYYSATLEHSKNYTSSSAGTTYVSPATGAASTTTSGTGDDSVGGATSFAGTIPVTLSANVTEGLAPLDVFFGFDSTHVNATNLSWDFQADIGGYDASGVGFPNATTFQYTTPGTYNAFVRATEGTEFGDAHLSIVVKREILATFAVSEADPFTGDAVTFDVTTDEPDAASLAWSVDLDGDGVDDANGTGLPASVPFTYGAIGTYTANLTVTDGTYTSTASLGIEAHEPLPPTGPGLDAVVGLTFGEAAVGGGYYVALFNDTGFMLGVPNATTGHFDPLENINVQGWGAVDPRKMDITDSHKYAVEVDGTTVTVTVDNGRVGTFALPGVPFGTFGVITGEDMRMNVGAVHWQALDTTAPEIEIFRPARGALYVQDVGIDTQTDLLPAVVAGTELTIGAHVTEETGGSGTKSVTVYVDGKTADFRRSPGMFENFTIDTSGLATGTHTIKLRALDWRENQAEMSVEFLILGPVVSPGHAAGSAVGLAEDLLGGL